MAEPTVHYWTGLDALKLAHNKSWLLVHSHAGRSWAAISLLWSILSLTSCAWPQRTSSWCVIKGHGDELPLWQKSTCPVIVYPGCFVLSKKKRNVGKQEDKTTVLPQRISASQHGNIHNIQPFCGQKVTGSEEDELINTNWSLWWYIYVDRQLKGALWRKTDWSASQETNRTLLSSQNPELSENS